MGLYAGIIFLLGSFYAATALLFTIVFYGKKKEAAVLRFIYQYPGNFIAKGMFLNVVKKHHYDFDSKQTYVVVSNHQTMIDIPANVVSSPDAILFKFLGKLEANRIPFFGFVINRLCILVDRKSKQSRKESYERMKNEMDNGYSIILYPEGTRNRSDEPVKSFYDGAFRLAIDMQKPLVVNTLVGIKQLNPPTETLSYTPGTVYSHWDAPISTIGLTRDDIPQLKEKVKEIMIKRLEE